MGKLTKLTDVVQADIVNLYVGGASLKEIAMKYDCTPPTVATFLRKNGVAVRGKGKRKKVAQAAVVEEVLEEEYTTIPQEESQEII